MQTDVRKCANCGGQMVYQNNQWVCMSCGSAFAVNWDSSDVERIRKATEQDRAAAQMERSQAMNMARQNIQLAEERNKRAREAKKTWYRILKPFILAGAVLLIMLVLNLVTTIAFGGFLRGGLFGSKNEKSSLLPNSSPITLKTLKEAIVKDPEVQKDMIASGAYYAKYETKQEIQLSDPDEVAVKTGEPEFLESYLRDHGGEKSIILVYKNTYQVKDSDRTKDVYCAYQLLFGNFLDADDKAMCYYTANIAHDETYIWKITGYESLEDLRKDNRLTVKPNDPTLMEIEIASGASANMDADTGSKSDGKKG